MLTLYCKVQILKAPGGILYPMIKEVEGELATREFGEKLGRALRGGEIIELAGDVGAGKTTFVKGLAKGLDIDEDVQSPSFTISRVYDGRDDLQLAHYDFYRLADAGIMADELKETLQDPQTITVIEWAGIVEGVLPKERLTIKFESPTETKRVLTLTGHAKLLEQL
jgi:tRNA threonylcarbamoyladenosine biosynthesis protein TsaE